MPPYKVKNMLMEYWPIGEEPDDASEEEKEAIGNRFSGELAFMIRKELNELDKLNLVSSLENQAKVRKTRCSFDLHVHNTPYLDWELKIVVKVEDLPLFLAGAFTELESTPEEVEDADVDDDTGAPALDKKFKLSFFAVEK